MEVNFTVFCEEHLDVAMELTSAEGWNLTESDLLFYAKGEHGTGIVALHDRTAVGIATAALYEEKAWIGNVVVSPEHRGTGIGGRMVSAFVQKLFTSRRRTVALYAYDRSRPLYEKLGFTFDALLKEVTVSGSLPARRADVVAISHTFSDSVSEFDFRYFRSDRKELLSDVLSRGNYSMTVASSVDGAEGYFIESEAAGYGTEVAPFIATESSLLPLLAELGGAKRPIHMYVNDEVLPLFRVHGIEVNIVRNIGRGFVGESSSMPLLSHEVLSSGFLDSG